MAHLRILLAEDHKDMRDRIVRVLESEFEVVGIVGDGEALLQATAMIKPDVCVIDISMPGIGGIEAAKQLKKRGATAKIVFLTVHEDSDFVRAALAVGASGYVVKSRMALDLRLAITEVMGCRVFISPSVLFEAQSDSNQE